MLHVQTKGKTLEGAENMTSNDLLSNHKPKQWEELVWSCGPHHVPPPPLPAAWTVSPVAAAASGATVCSS